MNNLLARREWNIFKVAFALTAIALFAAGKLDGVTIFQSAYAATPTLVALQMNASDSGVNISMPGMNMSASNNGVNMSIKDNSENVADPSKMPEFFLQMMNNMPMVYMSASASATPANGQQLSVSGQSMTVQINVGSQSNQIQIKSAGGHFAIDQSTSGTNTNTPPVSTTMGLSVNNQEHTLSAKTSSGLAPISVLPDRALSSAQSQQLIDSPNSATLIENQSTHRPVYQFDGVRNMKFLGLFGVPVNTQVQVDATNSRAEITNQPWYMNTFGWLFTPAT